MVSKQTWHKQLGDAEIPSWVKALGQVEEVQTLKTEEGAGTITLYRIVTESGAYRTVLANGPAILTNRDLGVLASLLLAEGFSPCSTSYERFVEAPAGEAEAKLKAEEAARVEANAYPFTFGTFEISGVMEPFETLWRGNMPGCVSQADATWLESRGAKMTFGTGAEMVKLSFLAQQGVHHVTVAAPSVNEAIAKARKIVALLTT